MDTINWGIIGCGDVTERKSGPAFNKVPHSRLAAVMRRNAAAAEDYARRHKVPKWYADADALIADPDVNAIYIATPPGSHYELALKVAAAGMPCYVEKPMARNAGECARMVEAFEQAKLPLFVAYYRRSHPHFQRVKAIIDSKQLGELRQLNYDFACGSMLSVNALDQWRYNPELAGGGLFWDLGSHALDLFDYWLGPLLDVSGHVINRTGNTAVEELAGMTAHSAAGVAIQCTWNFISSEHLDTVTLRFSGGVLRCSMFGHADLHITDASGEERVESYELPENVQHYLIANIVAALRSDEPALSTGASGLRTNRVIDLVAANRY
ncbi:Gfo/Idh/MocA family protein [Coraliomargarita parva]|uniref:Gfo/Idh/MocA family protein n=1 Tax=Coraliomargarita parva TaxID=3014050 RepID=UPI0022B4225B|nr:Gfo/Idh/MocA family oxidoreductase [Coraliomargarita parva]